MFQNLTMNSLRGILKIQIEQLGIGANALQYGIASQEMFVPGKCPRVSF